MPNRTHRIFIGIVIVFFGAGSSAQQLVATPYHAGGIYDVGEKVGWNISATGDSSNVHFTYTIKKDNFEQIKSGQLEFDSGKATIETSVDSSAMIYVEIKTDKKDAKPIALGAAVGATKFQPAAQRPEDFDSFWESKIKALEAIPANPQLTEKDSGKPDVEYSIIKMDHVDGKHVYGQIAKPKKEGKFPALVIFQWASPPYPLQKPWVTERAAEGWLALNIEPHDVLPDEQKAYYDALPTVIKNYSSIGNNDREKSYFLQMYLADYRAVEYIASRPDWDGKTLVVMGTSMGGQQSLCVAGLNPKITHLIVNEPAGCDTNGQLHGHQAGYPNFPSNDPKIMQTALYFDAVNFASHIKATSLVAMGFVDTVAPPTGIWTAFDQIQGAKEAVPMVDSPHNHLATPQQQMPYTNRSKEWLHALVKGENVEPKTSVAESDH